MATSEAAESIPTSTNTVQNFSLRVCNLPKDLEKDGVRSIFLDYGQVTGCILVSNKNETNQAFISYSTYSEAERAIHELHGKPPLMLRIEFRDKNLKSLHQPVVPDLSGPIIDHRYRESYLDNYKDMKKAIDMPPANYPPAFHPNTYSSDNDLLYPYPSDESTFNPYDAPGPYYESNLMYTRGTTHISKDGRRLVSFGRGYTYYNMPEPHCNIASHLQKVIEKRENRYYEYAPEEIEDDTGNCKVCSSATALRCQKCSVTFYCSRTCQVNDWPKHKLECSAIPPLVKRLPLKASQENGHTFPQQMQKPQTSTENLSAKEQNSLPVQHQPSFIQQPSPVKSAKNNSSFHQPAEESITGGNRQQNSPNNYKNNFSKNSPQKPYANKQQFSAQNEKPVSPPKQFPAQNQKPVTPQQNRPHNQQQFSRPQYQNQQGKRDPPPQRQQQSQQHQSQPIQQRKPPVSDDNIVFQPSNEFIPRDKFVDVLIMSTVNVGEYWVLCIDRLNELKQFSKKLKDHAAKAKIVKPEENMRCVIEQFDNWYRATIVSLKNEKSKVFLFDYGFYEDVVVDKVYLETFDTQPYFARQIRLVDSADANLKKLSAKDCLSVKAVTLNPDGSIVVQARSCPKEIRDSVRDPMGSGILTNTIVPAPVENLTDDEIFLKKLASTKNVIETVKPGEGGMIFLFAETSQDEYNVTLVPNEKVEQFSSLLDDLKDACLNELKKNPKFVPKIGEFVCGETNEGDWFRGIIAAVKPVIKLAVIDESRFFVPVRCTPLPPGYEKIDSLGLVCNFLPNAKPEKMFQSGAYEVLEISGNPTNSAVITLKSDDGTSRGKGQLKLWSPKTEQKGIQNPTLKSGNTVIALFMSSPAYLYVRSQETEEKERIHRLEQELAVYAEKRQPLDQTPVVGEMVLAHFTEDGNYYRAIVTKVEGEKIMVKYTDYGNDEVTSKKHLYKLPDLLKQQPAGCIKLKLKGVPADQPLTDQATEYYHALIADQVPMICTFEGNLIEDGVVLKTTANENVNELIKTGLLPSWEKNSTKVMNSEEEENVLRLTDLPSIKLGDVGDDINALILCFYPESGIVILGPQDEDAAKAIQYQLGDRIKKYAESAEYYIPRDNELCIALYENDFYRAVCLESSCSPEESRVFFVDYGNTERVKHKDIRAMKQDFLEFPAFGTFFNMSHMIPENKWSLVKDELINLIVANNLITGKIISKEDDDSLNIDFPHVRVALTEKGLL